ncbi:MAG: hypothetical protein ACHBN1_28130 [Heteroscytonema crispum UTEX LB 1556]
MSNIIVTGKAVVRIEVEDDDGKINPACRCWDISIADSAIFIQVESAIAFSQSSFPKL